MLAARRRITFRGVNALAPLTSVLLLGKRPAASTRDTSRRRSLTYHAPTSVEFQCFPIVIRLLDDSGAELDLSGWNAQAAMKRSSTQTSADLIFACTVSGGAITLEPPVPNTATPGKYVYDVILTKPDGSLRPVADGPIEVKVGITDAP